MVALRPGVQVLSRTTKPSRGAPSGTGTTFLGGLALKGPVNTPILLQSQGDFETYFGARDTRGYGWDGVDVALHTGASLIYFSRAAGPGEAVGTHTFNDAGAAASIAVDTWGPNSLAVTVQVIAGTINNAARVLVVTENAITVEQSPECASVANLVSWSQDSKYVRVRALGANVPAVVAAQTLTGGTDDAASITDTQRLAAINAIPASLGPGQVAYPGATTTTMQVGLLNHGQANNRFALLDLTDTATQATQTAAADSIRANGSLVSEAEEFGMAWSDWATVPGIVNNTIRTMPWSPIQAGLIAALDGESGNPNLLAAGVNGIADYVLGRTQLEWTATERDALNTKGVNTTHVVNGVVRAYGGRTLVDPAGSHAAWLQVTAARTRMAITFDGGNLAEQFLFSQLDGQGLKIKEFEGALRGMMLKYFNDGALYGASAADAFNVDTGSSVNTPTTIANGELHAVISFRTSPFAELVVVEIVRVAVTDSV